MLKAFPVFRPMILLLLCSLVSCQSGLGGVNPGKVLDTTGRLLAGSEGLKLSKVIDSKGMTILDFQSGDAGVEYVANLQTGSEGLKGGLQSGSEGLKVLQTKSSSLTGNILYEISVGQEKHTFLITSEYISGNSHMIRLIGLPEKQETTLTYKQFIDEKTDKDILIKQLAQKKFPVATTAHIPAPKFKELAVDGTVTVKSIVINKEKDPQATEPNDSVNFIGDVSIPDNMLFKPNKVFEKVWAIQNATNNIVWKDRTIENVDSNSCVGDGIITPDKNKLVIPQTFPGEILLVRVNMTAPSQPGTYRSTWKMKNSDGDLSFPGLSGIYAQIRVSNEEDTSSVKDALTISTQYVRDDGSTRNLPLNFVWPTNKLIMVRWKFKNNTNELISGWKMKNNEENICRDGFLTPQSTEFSIPDVVPGEEVSVDLGFTTPNNPGTILSTWNVFTNTATKSGQKGAIQLTVETPPKKSE